GHGAHQLTVVDVATHHHRLPGLDVGAAPDQQPRQPAPAFVDRQICHSPPRSTGTRVPSSCTPSTSISGLPIMKSMWIELEFTCCLSPSSLTRYPNPLPSAMWLAAVSSLRGEAKNRSTEPRRA